MPNVDSKLKAAGGVVGMVLYTLAIGFTGVLLNEEPFIQLAAIFLGGLAAMVALIAISVSSMRLWKLC